MHKTLFATVLLASIAVAQQPCPTGYHHEGDSAACWADVSHQQDHPAVQPTEQPIPTQPAPLQPAPIQPPHSQSVQPAQTASLVIFREGHFTGSALRPSIYIDGREVTRLKNGSYFSVQIEPGKHNLSSSVKHEPPLAVEFKPGETSYIQMIVVPGAWRGAGRLIPVPSDDGKNAVSKLHILN